MFGFIKKAHNWIKEKEIGEAVGEFFATSSYVPGALTGALAGIGIASLAIGVSPFIVAVSLVASVCNVVTYRAVGCSLKKMTVGGLVGFGLAFGAVKLAESHFPEQTLDKKTPPAAEIFNYEAGKVKAEITSALSTKVQAANKLQLRSPSRI